MKLKEKLLTLVVVLGISSVTCVPVFAGTINVNLKANQVWSSKYSVTRSGRNKYVSARLKSVYPASGEDNFEKIQARIVNNSGILVMDGASVTLDEKASEATQIELSNGNLNLKTVNFQFRGNTDKAASAVIGIDGN